MKSISKILIILVFLSSCESRQQNFQGRLDDLRQDFSSKAQKSNERALLWEATINNIYELAELFPLNAVDSINNLLLNDTTLNSGKRFDLNFVKGDIYYNIDSLQNALSVFSSSDLSFPKILAARAGVYVKLKQFDNAQKDLMKAAEMNYEYNWNIGNLYEILGQPDSAVLVYHKLYERDSVIYFQCKNRIVELRSDSPNLLKELSFRDRERKVILMNGIQ